MPVSHFIDVAQGVVITTVTGKITPSEATTYARRLKDDSRFDPNFRELIDLSQADVTGLDYASLSVLKDEDPFSSESQRAIVAPSAVSYGISRMYEAIRGGNLAVFQTKQEALEWLGLEWEHPKRKSSG